MTTTNNSDQLGPPLDWCPKCRMTMDGREALFCPSCGNRLIIKPAPLKCPRCGAKPAVNDNFCVYCGEPLPKLE
jgi:predicted amidophosphoribosyltransferase